MQATVFEAAAVGIVQGLTEFLPVSSSAHLVFAQKLFGWREPELFFDVMLHAATMLAVAVYLWKDIAGMFRNARLILLIAAATALTGVIGLLGEKYIVAAFSDPLYPALFLLVTGSFIYAGEKAGGKIAKTKNISGLSFPGAACIGIAQGIAVLPGISRSGATITAGIVLGIERTDAVKFAFLLSIPAILGATLFSLGKISTAGIGFAPCAAGFAAAFLTGILSLRIMLKAAEKMKLHYFSYYCWALGIIILVLLKIK